MCSFISQPEQRAALPRVIVTQKHLDYALENIGLESFGSDDRAGLSHTLHRISALRNRQGNIIGLTMRVGRALIGIASMIADILKSNLSILILGEPGSGKTSLVRDIARWLAHTQNVCHTSIGEARRMIITSLEAQAKIMVRSVQNYTPEVMVVDEIGRNTEVSAVATVKARGVRMIASAHGSFKALHQNTQLKGLLGNFTQVILEKGVPKLERTGDPIFSVFIETSRASYYTWTIIKNVSAAVDSIMIGVPFEAECRTRIDAKSYGRTFIQYNRSSRLFKHDSSACICDQDYMIKGAATNKPKQ
eukprot:18766-Heterococcus_DN1.PRE.1